MQKSGPQAITEKTPKAFRGEDDGLYADALRSSLPMFSPDGVMTQGGAEIVRTLVAAVRLARQKRHRVRRYGALAQHACG